MSISLSEDLSKAVISSFDNLNPFNAGCLVWQVTHCSEYCLANTGIALTLIL